MSTSEIELRFPSSIYYADPYAAIRSVLGNDVEIVSFKESNVILPDSSILINVEYSAIDFDLFKLWKVEETKITSNSTQKIVATVLKDTITGEKIDDPNKIVVISNYSPKYSLVFIKYLDRINLSNSNIKYYGFAPQCKSDVLHSYCSIVDTEFLSYHGSRLKAPLLETKNSGEYTKINVQNEVKAIQKLSISGIETNNFTNSGIDLNELLKFTNSNAIPQSIPEIEKEIKLENEILSAGTSESSTLKTQSGIINLNGISIDQAKQALVGQKGILILSRYRENPMAVCFINQYSNCVKITEEQINNLYLIIQYDCYNLKLWEKL